MASRGEPRDNAQGGFLGGARSPRSGCQALLMPGRSITRDGWPKARGLTERCPGEAQAFFNGRAEPAPPRRGQEPSRSSCALAGRRGEMPFFFGGTHSVRPDGKAVCRPRHFIPPDPLRIARWPSRDMPRSGHTHPRGRPRRPWVGVESVERRPWGAGQEVRRMVSLFEESRTSSPIASQPLRRPLRLCG